MMQQPNKTEQLVRTKLSLEEEHRYIVWFFRHQRRLGVRTFESLEKAYFMGKYWLEKGQKRFPDRKYRFALGEPVYIARRLWKKTGREVFSQHFATKVSAKEQIEHWQQAKGEGYTTDIVVAYRWEWISV